MLAYLRRRLHHDPNSKNLSDAEQAGFDLSKRSRGGSTVEFIVRANAGPTTSRAPLDTQRRSGMSRPGRRSVVDAVGFGTMPDASLIGSVFPGSQLPGSHE